MEQGKVYIVGGGPGDPGLITVKARNKLESADVIVYDRLVHNGLLAYCRDNAEKIFVGKEPGCHRVKQEEINRVLVNKAKQGLKVVRLKGGNPFIFARGSEEASALKNEGVEFEIIPGISSGTAAPIYSGIPITQRGVVTQCVLLTAHESPDKQSSQVEWKTLAKLKNTSFMIYMGASRIEKISSTLIENGLNPETPVAVIENATLSKQRTITGKLKDIAGKFRKDNLKAPVIIMISPTVEYRKDIAWWEKKPLYNKTVILTEACGSKTTLCDKIYDLGGDIKFMPLVKNKFLHPGRIVQDVFNSQSPEWIIFSDECAVENFFKYLDSESCDCRVFGAKKIAAVGKRTSEVLKKRGIVSDLTTGEFLSAAIGEKQDSLLTNKSSAALLIGENKSNTILSNTLSKYFSKIEKLNIYESVPTKPGEELINDLNTQGTDIILFTSSVSINNFFEVLGSKTAANILNNCNSIVVDNNPEEYFSNRNIRDCNLKSMDNVKGISEFIRELA